MTQVNPFWITSKMLSILVPYKWPSRSPCSTSLDPLQSHQHHSQRHIQANTTTLTYTPAAASHLLKLLLTNKMKLFSWLLITSDWPSGVCRKDSLNQLRRFCTVLPRPASLSTVRFVGVCMSMQHACKYIILLPPSIKGQAS